MTSANQFSERRRIAGQVAIASATIVLVIVLSQSLGALLFSQHVIWFRLYVMFAVSLFLIAGAAIACRARSVYWQIPLQSVALASLLVGIPVIVSAVFSDWHVLLGPTGFRTGACVALGFVTGWLLLRLQERIPNAPEA